MTKRNQLSLRASRAVLFACWLVYTIAYIARNTYSASIVTLTGAGMLSKEIAGVVGTCYFVCYGAGHLINGILADRVSPVAMIVAGLAGTTACNLIMPAVTPTVWAMIAVWSANGFLQAMLWSPIINILSMRIKREFRDRAMVIISTTVPVGTVLAYLTTSVCQKLGVGWRLPYFIAAGGAIAACAVFAAIAASTLGKKAAPESDPATDSPKPENEPATDSPKPLRDRTTDSRDIPESETATDSPKPLNNRTTDSRDIPENDETTDSPLEKIPGGRSIVAFLAATGTLVFLVPVVFHGMLKDGILTWVPSMISETYGTSESFATLLTVGLPVANLFGSLISNALFIRVFRRNHAAAGAFIMVLAAIPTALVINAGALPIAAGVACLCALSMLMSGVNYLFSTLLPTKFAAFGRTATVSGIFNSAIYLGSAISTYVFGAVAERFSWSATVALWLALTVASAVVLVIMIRPWRRFLDTLSD